MSGGNPLDFLYRTARSIDEGFCLTEHWSNDSRYLNTDVFLLLMGAIKKVDYTDQLIVYVAFEGKSQKDQVIQRPVQAGSSDDKQK